MSCFKGRMREYRNISIDRFDADNLKSTAFFLSHIHSDHTVGLNLDVFYERLQSSSDIFLYCSEVTKLLLLEKDKYSRLQDYVCVLPIDKPTNVSIPQLSSCKADMVQVTLLHAAHCPGSVMFLFEGSDGTCLYTGDFRWEKDQISNIKALHHKDKSVKDIDSLYIDTTFCHESSIYIPSREDSANAVYHLVKEWIAQGSNYVVHFTPRSQYGHEHLLKDVYTRTGHKIHVAEEKWKIYQKIPGLEDVFTCNPSETPVHACKVDCSGKWSSDSLPCKYSTDKIKVMVILPSTMYFTMRLNLDLSHIIERKGFIHRVCYSFHSSYIEVKDLVTYLQPKFVRPNVKPLPDKTILKVQGRLNEFLKLTNSKKICNSQRIKPLGKLRRSKLTKKRSMSENSSESLDLCFGTPEKIPPAKKARKLDDVESDDEDTHSSYAGSVHNDSEMSDICQSDDEKLENDGETRPESLSLPGQSLLAALDDIDTQCSQGSEVEPLTCRVCMDNDEEQVSAVVIPSSQLDENEYKNTDVEISIIYTRVPNKEAKGDCVGENGPSEYKGDNPDNQCKPHRNEEESVDMEKVCETLSTPGQSLLEAEGVLESAEKPAITSQKTTTDRKPSRSDSYEDKFMLFLRNGDRDDNQNQGSDGELGVTECVDKNTSHNHDDSQKSDPSNDVTENNLETEEDSKISHISETNNGIEIIQENDSIVNHKEVNKKDIVIIDSSCSTVNTCDSVENEEVVRVNGHSSDKVHSKHDKGSLEDLFGSDDDNNDTIYSDDEIMNEDNRNKTSNNVKSVTEDSGKDSNVVNGKGCVMVCCDSDSEDEEHSILSGKKLSRNNSIQNQGVENHSAVKTIENVVDNVLTSAVDKLSSSGSCQSTAIVLDDDDSDDETIPPSQHSDASMETISPFLTPVKHGPATGRNHLQSPANRPASGRNQNSSCSPVKISPMKNASILPYLSPVKNQTPEKLVCQVGDMLILNNDVCDTDDSSMIDLTASDDDNDTDQTTDDATQDYFVID